MSQQELCRISQMGSAADKDLSAECKSSARTGHSPFDKVIAFASSFWGPTFFLSLPGMETSG